MNVLDLLHGQHEVEGEVLKRFLGKDGAELVYELFLRFIGAGYLYFEKQVDEITEGVKTCSTGNYYHLSGREIMQLQAFAAWFA
jgi:hypothetical protein